MCLVQIKPSWDDVKYLECISHLVDITQKFHIIFSKHIYVHALKLFIQELSQLLNSTLVPNEIIPRRGPPQLNIRKFIEKSTRDLFLKYQPMYYKRGCPRLKTINIVGGPRLKVSTYCIKTINKLKGPCVKVSTIMQGDP